jgi:hypothetical protein
MNIARWSHLPIVSAELTVPRLRTVLIALSSLFLVACVDPGESRLKGRIQPAYDQSTGRLTELLFDSTGNGRVDTWTEMDGTTPLRSRIDTNGDGRIDRWEYYNANGDLTKVGFSRADNGHADAWVFSGADGTVQRIEISSTGDEHRIDRWEHYDASRSDAAGGGALVRAEEDTTGDGKPDKWETYEGDAIRAVAFDENGNGRPDRRLTHARSGLLVIESHPDASGRFTRRVEVR